MKAQQPGKGSTQSILIRMLVFGIMIITGLFLAMGGFFTARYLVRAMGSAREAQKLVLNEQTGELEQESNGQSANISGNPNAPASLPALTPWDGVGRVNVLLVGLDYRDWQSSEEYSRSDTMILLTLDPLNKTAGMLSIPRDLWVGIPGFKHGKINTAYYLGDAYKLPGGGPGLAVKTVEQFLGVPINYYAQIDFGAFVRFVDELGGVKINVPEAITIDLLGSGSSTKKNLKPGVQVLPGEWALAYARNRYTHGGDFDRAKRQQQVIMAIRDRILSFNMLPTLVAKAPALYRELSSGVHTNLTLDDVTRLAVLASQVPRDQIKQGVIDEKYILFGTSPDALSIVIPLPDKIFLLRDEIFAGSDSLSPLTPGTLADRMKAEAANVVLYNASGAPGLAERTASILGGEGMNVTKVGEADQQSSVTTIVDHTGNPATVGYLANLMQVSENRIQLEYQADYPAGVEVYLGGDWARNVP